MWRRSGRGGVSTARGRSRTGAALGLLAALTVFGTGLAPGPAQAQAPAPRARTAVLSARRVMAKVAEDRANTALANNVNKLLQAPENKPWLNDGCVSVTVGNRPIAAHRTTSQVTPASSLKTLAAFTVLTKFPPDHRFRTEVKGQRTGSTVTGPLYLVGSGDPLLETDKAPPPYNPAIAEGHPRTRLEELADQVAKSGITKVGAVVGDGTAFDDQRTSPEWKPSFVPTEVAPIGALVVNDGRSRPTTRSDASPAGDAAALFADLLRARGVNVGGASTAGRAEGQVLAGVDSPPLEAIVGEMMRESDNTTAEMLVKVLGHQATGRPGTTADGLAVIRRTLTEAGIDVGPLAQVDGSGLGGGSKVTCELLRNVMAKPGRNSPLARTLSVAGTRGTLVDRMKRTPAEGRLIAKTGTLDGVSALIGWVDPATPGAYQPVSFSAVSNGVPLPLEKLGQFGDRLGVAMATYPESFDPRAVAPQPPA